MGQGYSLKRIHRVNLFAVYGIALIFIIKTVLFEKGMEDALYSLGVMALVTIIFFIPMNDLVKGFFIGLVPTLTGIALTYVNGFNLAHHYILIISVAIIALYFEAKLLVVYSVFLNLAIIAMYLTVPDALIGAGTSIGNFLSLLLMLDGALVLLFFLNKWGKKIIDLSASEERKINEMVASMSSTMNEVENGTIILGNNTATMSDNASATLESSKQVAIAMQEIAVGVQEQAGSVTDINMQVEAISNDVGEAHKISEHLTGSNQDMMGEVTNGEEQIAHMKDQMQIIDDAIEAAIVTVKELENSMGDIQNFLEVITNISSQTNLLALNASIESARAGEAGKGFAVVADEIRKLAEQSAESVQDINNIVESVGRKTQEAVTTVNQGNEAVDEGSEIIGRITNQYNLIKESFVKNNDELDREIKMIDQINDSFVVVHERISNIASISEEQSASTEEILATIENQESNIENLTMSLKDIEALSEKLTDLIEVNHN